MKEKMKGTVKMGNVYILHRRVLLNRQRAAEIRRIIAKVASVACRVGMVLGFIVFIGIWAGAESGALIIGRRLLWTAADVIFFLAMAAGWTVSEGCRDE